MALLTPCFGLKCFVILIMFTDALCFLFYFYQAKLSVVASFSVKLLMCLFGSNEENPFIKIAVRHS